MSGEKIPTRSTLSRSMRREHVTSIGVSECIDNSCVSTSMLPEPFQIPLRVSERLAARQLYPAAHLPNEHNAWKVELQTHKQQEPSKEITKNVTDDNDDDTRRENIERTAKVQKPLIASPSWRREMFMSSVHKWSNHTQNTQNNDISNMQSTTTNMTKRARAKIGDEFISFDTSHIKTKKKEAHMRIANNNNNDEDNEYEQSSMSDESVSSGVLSSEESYHNDETDLDDISDEDNDVNVTEKYKHNKSSLAMNRSHGRARVRDLSQRDKVMLEEHLRTFDDKYLEHEEAVLYNENNNSSSNDDDDDDDRDSDNSENDFDESESNSITSTNEFCNKQEEEHTEEHKHKHKGKTNSDKTTDKWPYINGCRRFRDVYFECYDPSEMRKVSITEESEPESKPTDKLFTINTTANKDNTHELDFTYMAHHTLLGLKGPVTINGPCGLVGLSRNEISVNGFYLGGKQLTLWLPSQRVELLPVCALSDKSLKMTHVPSYVKASRKVHSEMVKQIVTQQSNNNTNKKENKSNDECKTCKTAASGRGVVLHPGMFESNLATSAVIDNTEQINALELCNSFTTWEPSTLYDVEKVFGWIDWAWVEQTLQAWNTMHILARVKAVVLIVQLAPDKGSKCSNDNNNELVFSPLRQFPCTPRHVNKAAAATITTKGMKENKFEELNTSHSCNSDSSKNEEQSTHSIDNGHVEQSQHQEVSIKETGKVSHKYIPSFIARGRVPGINPSLHERVIPAIASVRSGVAAMVVGSINMGKSTLLRSLANTLISQHGSCFWADFDAGQSEFGVPGELSLYQLHYPLLQPHDVHYASHITSFFIGSSTLSNPLITSQAIVALCEMINNYIAPHAPVVINTHGWVLETGRRVTLEIMRRLQPQHVVYLKEQNELSWLNSSENIMSGAIKRGLNANVVARRFLVRAECANTTLLHNIIKNNNSKSKNKKSIINNCSEQHCCCLLPYAHTTTPKNTNSNNNKVKKYSSGKNENETCNITIHTIHVNREEWNVNNNNSITFLPSSSSPPLLQSQNVHKHVRYGIVQSRSKARQMYWQLYFDPLIRFYEATHYNTLWKNKNYHNKPIDSANHNNNTIIECNYSNACNTTLITAPLKELSSIVVASIDELDAAPTLQEVAAMLEHAVVAIQFHWQECKTKTAKGETNNNPRNGVWKDTCYFKKEYEEKESSTPIKVIGLSAWRDGFEVSCYGYVESVEEELLGSNTSVRNTTQKIKNSGVITNSIKIGEDGGTISIRVPFAPSTIKSMMSSTTDINVQLTNECKQNNSTNISSHKWSVGVAIAYSPALCHDTSFLEHYPYMESQ